MSSRTQTLDIPKRVPLSAQTVAAIRKGILEGVWKEFLPGERRLCDALQVSRPTVRTALRLLAKEGLIEIRQGLRNRIVSGGGRARGAQSRLIAIFTLDPIPAMSIDIYHSIREMQRHLAKHGFVTEVIVCQARGGLAQRRKVESFMRENRVFCWVLHSVSRELQQWFASRSIPAFVLGTCFSSVRLPSLDVDHRSACRHAAGIFLSKGHRCMALIVPDALHGGAGTLASEQGYLEAVEKRSAPDDVRAVIVRHDGTAKDISAKLDALFNSPQKPTALLVARLQCVFFVIIYLLKRGLSVPNTVSLISRDQDSSFASFSPPISHYSFNGEVFNRRLTRLIVQIVNRGHLPTEPNLIIPRFYAGGTVKSIA